MIRFETLCVSYDKLVLHEITGTFATGQVTAIIGPNGCGKSTLLKAVAGLLTPTSGKALLYEKPVSAYKSQALARIMTYLPQSRNLPDITVERLVLHGRFPYMGMPRRYTAADKQLARDAMERTEVLALAQKPLAALSGGERQRVYLAMAVAQDTPLILLDEPTTFLDIDSRLELMRLICSLCSTGKTVVMVLHDLGLAFRFADSVAVMRDGRLLMVGEPRKVCESGCVSEVFRVKARCERSALGEIRYYFD